MVYNRLYNLIGCVVIETDDGARYAFCPFKVFDLFCVGVLEPIGADDKDVHLLQPLCCLLFATVLLVVGREMATFFGMILVC